MKIFGFALIASVCVAGSAWASPPYSAKLAQPVASSEGVTAGVTNFYCSDSTCVSVSEPLDASNVGTCHQLALKVGEVVAYGNPFHSFDAAALARCNQKD